MAGVAPRVALAATAGAQRNHGALGHHRAAVGKHYLHRPFDQHWAAANRCHPPGPTPGRFHESPPRLLLFPRPHQCLGTARHAELARNTDTLMRREYSMDRELASVDSSRTRVSG